MKVLLCGAAGWTGRAVLAELLRQPGWDVRALEVRAESWQDPVAEEDGPAPSDPRVELLYADMADFAAVEAAVEGCDAVVHTSVYFPDPQASGEFGSGEHESDEKGWLVNLKGLWNLLECSRRHGIRRVVHVGSCSTKWGGSTAHPQPGSVTYEADVRRPDGHLYAVYKRLQEEMCRQFFDAFALPIIVLRPAYIVDLGLALGRGKEPLETVSESWIDRHQLAEA